MILNATLIAFGFLWVVAATFFRSVLDPWFSAYPLLSTLVLAIILLTYATTLILSGSNLGRPTTSQKKSFRGPTSPPFYYIVQWAFISLIFVIGGFTVRTSNGMLSVLLWVTAAVILLSLFLFLMIPQSFRAESSTGDIVAVENKLHLKEGAFGFWDTCIMSGGFFLIIGALLQPFSIVSGYLSIGTGLAWLLGAVSFALVASFFLGGFTRMEKSPYVSLIPEENFAYFIGRSPAKSALLDAYTSYMRSRSIFRATKNGILLWGPSERGRLHFVRALAGETGRALLEFPLSNLKDSFPNGHAESLKNLFYKIRLHKPTLVFIRDYQETLSHTAPHSGAWENAKSFMARLTAQKDALVVAVAQDLEEIPKEFRSPPLIHWTIELKTPDLGTRIGLLRITLKNQALKNELLPGNIPLLTEEMIGGYDLKKLAELMEGFDTEDIEEILQNSLRNARNVKRSLRQLDIDVAIRRKKQGWEDPTLEPMEFIRSRLTPDVLQPAVVERAAARILSQKRRTNDATLVIGTDPALRRMLVKQLAERERYHYALINQKELARDSLGAFRNFIIQNKRHRPALLFVDPVELLFPKVQLSHFGYHGEIYNQKVIELSQVLQERQFWLVCGTPNINEVDPMILRKFGRVIELADVQRELTQEVEDYALGQILEGVLPEEINLSRFNLSKTSRSDQGEPETDGKSSGANTDSFHLFLNPVPDSPIPGFHGRTETQSEILNVLDSAKLNIRSHGSAVLGSFFFLGPSQSGKKTLAECLSKFLFNQKDAFVYRDMGLYEEIFFAEQFIHKPVDLRKTGTMVPEGLWDVFSKNPQRLLYLDNVERAHPSLWDAFLPILRDGSVSWHKKSIPLPGTIVILASTLFSPSDFEGKEPWERSAEITRTVQKANRRLAFLPIFQESFLGSMDLVVPFPAYTPSEIVEITTATANTVLRDFAEKITRSGSLRVDPSVYVSLAGKFDPETTGLGRLERTVQNSFIQPLKQMKDILDASKDNRDFVLLWNNDRIVVEETVLSESPEPAVRSA